MLKNQCPYRKRGAIRTLALITVVCVFLTSGATFGVFGDDQPGTQTNIDAVSIDLENGEQEYSKTELIESDGLNEADENEFNENEFNENEDNENEDNENEVNENEEAENEAIESDPQEGEEEGETSQSGNDVEDSTGFDAAQPDEIQMTMGIMNLSGVFGTPIVVNAQGTLQGLLDGPDNPNEDGVTELSIDLGGVALELNEPLTISSSKNLQINFNNGVINVAGSHRHFSISAGGKLTLLNVTLDGVDMDSPGGGIELNGAELVVAGGANITRCNAEFGGGIYADSSIVTVENGGKVSGNHAHDGYDSGGGGIYAKNDSAVTVNGGEVSDNTSISYGGGIFTHIDSTVTVKGNGAVINNKASSGGGISSWENSPVTVEVGGEVRDNEADNGGGIYTKENSPVTVSGGKVISNDAENGGGICVYGDSSVRVENKGEVSDNEAIFGGGIYANHNTPVTVSGGKVNDNVSNRGGGIYAWRSAVTVEDNGEVSGNAATSSIDYGGAGEGGGIYTTYEAFVTVNGGKVNGNTAIQGGGINTYSESAVTVKNGGEVSGNTAEDEGGGIYVDGAPVMIISEEAGGGKVSKNTASIGGGIYTTYEAFVTVSGGKVSENTALEAYGGGIYAYEDSTVTVESDGEVSDNTAYSGGGGIYVGWNSSLSVSDSKIIGNTENGHNSGDGGGGIYADGSSVTLTNALVSNNNAGYGGGGIYATGSPVMISGGEISNNTYSTYGGGIYATGSHVTVEGGKINGNRAVYIEGFEDASCGGGLYAGASSSLTVSSGEVSGNEAEFGGGIYAHSGATVEVSGAEINNNSASADGGGIYMDERNNLTITGITFQGNTASKGYKWTFGNEQADPDGDYEAIHKANITNTEYSEYMLGVHFTNAYNNYDVNFIAPVCTVTFQSDTGDVISEQVVVIGEKLIEPEVPSKTNHTPDGWYTENPESKWDFDEPVTEGDMTLKAKYTKNTFQFSTESGVITVQVQAKFPYPADYQYNLPNDVISAEQFLDTNNNIKNAELNQKLGVKLSINDVQQTGNQFTFATAANAWRTVRTHDITVSTVVGEETLSGVLAGQLKVVDKLEPYIVTKTDSVDIPLGQEVMTIDEAISTFINKDKTIDNYTEQKDLTYEVFGLGDVKNDKLKGYEITFEVTDENGNTATKTVTINYVMVGDPTLSCLTYISYPVATRASQYVKEADFLENIAASAKDALERELKVYVDDYSKINFGVVGTYYVNLISAEDANGKTAGPKRVAVNIYKPNTNNPSPGGGGNNNDDDDDDDGDGPTTPTTPEPTEPEADDTETGDTETGDTETDDTETGGEAERGSDGGDEGDWNNNEGSSDYDEGQNAQYTAVPQSVGVEPNDDGSYTVSVNGRNITAIYNPETELFDLFDEFGAPLGSVNIPEGKTLEEVILENGLLPQGTRGGKSNPKTGRLDMGMSLTSFILAVVIATIGVIMIKGMRTRRH